MFRQADSSGMTTRIIAPGETSWPPYAPAWAQQAVVECWDDIALAVTFERSWSLPSAHLDGLSLEVLRVCQSFQLGPDDQPASGEPWVMGPEGLWFHYQHEEIAKLLRELADMLAPQPTARLAGD